MRIVFMGTPEYAAVSLERLLGTDHEIVAVVTRPDKPAGRGKRMHASAVKQLARERGIEVLDPPSPREESFAERLRTMTPDLAVVVAYGRILPAAVLEIPRLGCINAHGSLLPLLRGAAPIERAILTGLDETGVTIMQMSEGMDEGPALLWRSVPIEPTTDGGTLRQRLAELSADLFVEAVAAIEAGTAQATPQDDRLATYAPPLTKAETAIDWTESAAAVDRRVRAFAPRPGAFTIDAGRRLKILEAHPLESPADDRSPGVINESANDEMIVACGSGALAVRLVQPEGKKPMSAGDYARGCRDLDPHRTLDAAS